jgi:O-antigen/teichoic acid export membrane protein
VERKHTFIQPINNFIDDVSARLGIKPRNLTALWVAALGLLSIGIAISPSVTIIILLGLCIIIPVIFLVWSRPELGVLGTIFLTSSFIPPDIVDLRLPIGGGIELRDMAILGMLALLVLRGLSNRSFGIPWWPVSGPLLSFLIIGLISAFYAFFALNVNLNHILSELRIIIYYGAFFIAAWSIRRTSQVTTVLVGLFLLADLTAVAVILQQFFGTSNFILSGMESTNWQFWDAGGTGLGSVRIVPAGHVLMVFMMVIAFCLMISSWKSRRIRFLSLFHFIFLNIGLLFTYTRAQWIGATTAILIAVVVLLPHYRALMTRLFVIALAGVIFILGFLGSDLEGLIRSVPVVDSVVERALSVLEVRETIDSDSLQWRMFETRESFRSIRENPWSGVGLGNSYREVTTLQGENLGWMVNARGITDIYRFTRYVHNSFLMIAVKMGIPGILTFLWFCAAFLVSSWIIFRRIKHDMARGVVLGAFAGFVGVLLWSIFHSHLMEPQSTPVIALMVGLVAGIGPLYEPKSMSSHTIIRSNLIQYPKDSHRKDKNLLDQPPHSSPIPSPIRSDFSNSLVYTLAGSGVTISLLFIETMIASRWLDTFNFGIYILALAVVNFFVMAIDFGFKTAITKLMASSDRERQGNLITNTLIFRLATATLISVIILVGRKLLSIIDPTNSLTQLAAIIPVMIAVYSFDELLSAMLQGLQLYRHMAIAQITRSILRLGMSIFFLGVLKLGMMSLIYSWLISFGISAIYQYIILPIPKRFSFKTDILREILGFGAPIQITRFLWFAAGQIHIFLLSTLSGPVSVAIYGIADKIPSALQRLAESYTAVFFPTVTNLLSKEQRDEALAVINASLRLLSFLGALTALVAILFSQEVIILLFTEKYIRSAFVFGLLVLALHMGMLINLMGYTLTAAGYPGRSLSENILRSTINVGGSYVLIPILGYLGPAIAKIAASYSSNPISIWLLRKSKIKVKVSPILFQTFLVLISAAFYWGTQPFNLFQKAMVIVFFIVISLLFPTITLDDLGLILPRFRLGIRRFIRGRGSKHSVIVEA